MVHAKNLKSIEKTFFCYISSREQDRKEFNSGVHISKHGQQNALNATEIDDRREKGNTDFRFDLGYSGILNGSFPSRYSSLDGGPG